MIATELTDVQFKGKGGAISLASLGLHVENQGVNTMFSLPSYSNVNSVDWQEYDGEDVDFSSASLDPVNLQIKVFGTRSTLDKLVDDLRKATTDSDITVAVKIKEGNFNNSINFSTKFVGATLGKMVVVNDWELQHFYLTDEDSRNILTEAEAMLLAGIDVKVLRQIAFATLTFSRYNNVEYFGLLGDNTRACEGIPQDQFTFRNYPVTNMPIELQRYHLNGRTAEYVSKFDLKDSRVFCYPVRGIVQGLAGYAESKTPFEISTENMVGKVMQTKNADKRRAKNITVPLLIRSHSVSAIFYFLGNLKNYIHDTLKGGDLLYLHSETEGDFAIYPSGCNIKKAYIKNQPWVEMDLQFTAYKYGFDFSASTDNVPEDNPEPPLPPAPTPTFDPYKGIDRSKWRVPTFSTTIDTYNMNYPTLVSPVATTGFQMPYDNKSYVASARVGWSEYTKYIKRYPVGTLFFAQRNTKTTNGTTRTVYNTCICLPWCVSKLPAYLLGFTMSAISQGWSKTSITLVGVVQGCDVLSKNIDNWNSELTDKGGIVGTGTVRVHSDVYAIKDNFTIADGLTLTTSTDFDTLVNNTITEYNEDPLTYYTETGFNNAKKA